MKAMRFWREYMKFPVIAVAFAVLVGYSLLVVNESANSQSTSIDPVGYAIGPGQAVAVQTTAAVQVIGQNATRRFIEICNPTTSTTIWIAPLPLQAVTPGAALIGGALTQGAGSYPLFPIISGPSSTVNATVNCYRTPFAPNAQAGYVGSAWSAIAQGSVLGALTIYEY